MLKKHKNRHRFLQSCIIFFVIGCLYFFLSSPQGSQYATGLGVLSAALVFALQNYVASFFSYIYIVVSRQFELGDIVMTGNPWMTAKGEIEHIGFFFTSIKEVDEELLFTGKTISFPNNLIFVGGIFNYTKHNLLFWHEFTALLRVGKQQKASDVFVLLKKIIFERYDYFLEESAKNESEENILHKPKFERKITTRGLECKVKLLIQFYKVLDLNNVLTAALIDAHHENIIYLVQEPEYNWLEDK